MKVAFTILSIVFYSATILADTGPWYIGGSLGEVREVGLDDLTSADLARAVELTGIPPQFTPTIKSTSSESYTDIDWKLYTGYRFNDYLGVEAQYVGLHSKARKTTLSGAIGLFSPANLKEETDIKNYGVSLVGTYPLTSSYSVFAKAGVFNWESETKVKLAVQTGLFCIILCAPVTRSGSSTLDDSGTGTMYGLGVSYSEGSLVYRFEWERFSGIDYGIDLEGDMEMWSVGVQYQFGFWEY